MIDKKIGNKCTGCTACVNICPKNAITMKTENTGFKYPVINQKKCVNCKLCKKICPVLNTKKNKSINECYMGSAKNENIQKTSSSGGIFSILANYILDNNGIVIGAAFVDNKLKHIAITNKDELEQLKGSKYLQSDLEDIFKFVKYKLKENKILFVGVPCQVAGLKAFLKSDYDNLLCIELICHGVPTPKLFDKYVKEIEKNENDKLVKYNFRDKSTGWETYSNTAVLSKKEITELYSENNYMKLFLSDVALRKSCFNCNFKLGNKYADITLGDFWGIKNYYYEMYNENGVSAIIINTKKGKEYFDAVKKNLKFKECNIESIIKGNPSLKKSVKYNKNYENFFRDINYLNIDKLVEKYGAKEITLLARFKNLARKIIKFLRK